MKQRHSVRWTALERQIKGQRLREKSAKECERLRGKERCCLLTSSNAFNTNTNTNTNTNKYRFGCIDLFRVRILDVDTI